MNEESSFPQPFHQRACALFFFLFTASISRFILHFVVPNTIYSLPHCRSGWSTEQPQIKGRGKIAFVIRTAVGLQAAETIICLEEKQQWEGVCVSPGAGKFVGPPEASPPLKSCWFDESRAQIFAPIPSVSCPMVLGVGEHESKGIEGISWVWDDNVTGCGSSNGSQVSTPLSGLVLDTCVVSLYF